MDDGARTEAKGKARSSGTDSRLDFPPELRRRLAGRDPEALHAFYEAYFERVYGYVRRLVGEEQLAEDLTQDVFMHIQRALHTYDPERDLRPWVFTIASNKVRDLWRSRGFRDGRASVSLDAEESGVRPVAADGDPRRALEGKELEEVLARAIEALPESMRGAFLLRWSEELSFEEIAAVLGLNEEAARKRYSRALAELRRALGPFLGLEQPGDLGRGGSA